MILCSYFNQL